MGSNDICGGQGYLGGDVVRKALNPVGLFAVGAMLGVLSKLLDIMTVNHVLLEQLGFMFSELPIWVLFGILITVYSDTQRQAMLVIFPFCLGMLIAYYVTAEATGSVYGWAFIKGWTVFSCLSPVFAYMTWLTKEKGLLSVAISIGIVMATVIGNFVLLRGVKASLSDFLVIPMIVFLLFFKSYSEHSDAGKA
jgi:hypothetical protein